MARVALYARFSSDNQKDSSVTVQFRNWEPARRKKAGPSPIGTRTKPSRAVSTSVQTISTC